MTQTPPETSDATTGQDVPETVYAGRTFDTARIEELDSELKALNIELPESPDSPEFQHLLERLGATHPSLAHRLSQATVDDLSQAARARMASLGQKGNARTRLARKATSALRTENHKGRSQLNPTVFKLGAGALFLAGAVYFVWFSGGSTPATAEKKDAAETTTTQTTATDKAVNKDVPTAPTGTMSGPPTPAGQVTAVRPGPALNPDGTPNKPVSSGSGGGSTSTSGKTQVAGGGRQLPSIPTDSDNPADSYTAPNPATQVDDTSAPTPVPVTSAPVATRRTLPPPTASDVALLQRMYGDGSSGTDASTGGSPTGATGSTSAAPSVKPDGARVSTPAPVITLTPPPGTPTSTAAAAPNVISRGTDVPATRLSKGGSSSVAPQPSTPSRPATLITQSAPRTDSAPAGGSAGVTATNAAPAAARYALVSQSTQAAPAATSAKLGLTGVTATAPASTNSVRVGMVSQSSGATAAAPARSGLYGPGSGGAASASSLPGRSSVNGAGTVPAVAPALPYRMGDMPSGTLLTGMAFVQPVGGAASGSSAMQGQAQPKFTVYAQTEDGNRWRGTAQLAGGGRISVAFDRVLIDDVEYTVQAEAVGRDAARMTGLQGNVRRETPDGANNILQALAGGVRSFVEQSAKGSTTVTPNGTVVTSTPRPNFWVTTLGAVASAYSPPAPSITQVDVVYLEAGAPLTIVVRGAGGQ